MGEALLADGGSYLDRDEGFAQLRLSSDSFPSLQVVYILKSEKI